MRVGIVCPSEIALKRFLPALSKLSDFKFVGVATATIDEWFGEENTQRSVSFEYNVIEKEKEKASHFIKNYGGKLFESYESIIKSDEIDSIYIPLPPALHFKWAKLALLSGKHLLLEKPATTNLRETQELISIAEQNNLAIHENYMFVYHSQIISINEIINSGIIGEVRIKRLSFGFPRRSKYDFRYNKNLGGGALLDCGGYPIKYASILLGETARIVYAQSNTINEFDVDIFGSAALINDSGEIVQIAFGIDNSYKCDIEAWGSLGCLISERVFTAPDDYIPIIYIKNDNGTKILELSPDNSFRNSIIRFWNCIENDSIKKENYRNILRQAELVDSFVKYAK